MLKSARGVPSGSIAYPSQRGGDGLETSSIVFFGHSLARADCSYFESILLFGNMDYSADLLKEIHRSSY